MITVYEEGPAAWDALESSRPHMVQVAKLVHSNYEFDAAVGSINGCYKWRLGGTVPVSRFERNAKEWLDAQKAVPVEEAPKATSAMLLVAYPAGGKDKVSRVLTLLGCEVIEV
jgi:hypothetical protein